MFLILNSFVLEKSVRKRAKKIKPYTTKWLYINGRGRRIRSRLPARSVLLHFVQRSPPETRTPRHAPRASGKFCLTKRNSHQNGDCFFLAGAEGLEPSARGFGAKSTLSVKPRVKIQSL